MSGVRLEAKVHIIIGATTSIQNIAKSVNRVGLDIQGIVLEQLASSEAVLSQDEKELGVALIDVGGGTTSIAVYYEGSIKHTAVLPVGGIYVTNDIAVGLRTPAVDAEKIKLKYGCAFIPLIPQDDIIEVPSVGGREPRQVSRQVLGEIIEPRMEEILGLAQREIIRAGCEDLLAAGVVITGGTANLEGIAELGEQIFNVPVRRGCPAGVGGITDIIDNPLYATAVGLVIHGSRSRSVEHVPDSRLRRLIVYIHTIKKWFDDFF
jgi:cell division protein FtsA